MKNKASGLSTQSAQEIIYQFLLSLVRQKPPASVLAEFKHLFLEYELSDGNQEALKALSELIFTNNEKDFCHTLKRSCYILVNNWDTSRNHNYIKELVDFLTEYKDIKKTISPTLTRLRTWLSNFVKSEDYDELKLFLAKYGYGSKEHWSKRYTSYLLVPQYTNTQNPVEQREAARVLSNKLKDQFKFDLAMYTARLQSPVAKFKTHQNPTGLGDEIIRFIKMIVARRGNFSHENLARIFLQQTQAINYKCFKNSLQKYLIFSVANKDFVEVLNQKLAEKLKNLYTNHHDQTLNDALLLRTSNRVIEYLTTEDHREPSGLFVLLLSHGHPLTLVIVLLKIILICPSARTHLETCIAQLIQYYIDYPEDECKWVVNFFEVFNITFAIHADNVQYNLIAMEPKNSSKSDKKAALDQYRVFSQLRDEFRIEEGVE
jgi:predicted house-cleaning noncanonical NTP pyrophosphatase (MazG superfamily)